MAKVVIVGGVAGGATTASQLRRINKELEIVIFNKGEHISFGNCGMPYYIGGEVSKRDKLIAATPQSFKEKNVDVFVRHEVTHVFSEDNQIQVKDLNTDTTFLYDYDYLVLSPGGRPRQLPQLENIDFAFSLHTLTDMDQIDHYIKNHRVKNAIVVGAGDIGFEMIENLTHREINVTLVHRNQHVHSAFEKEFTEKVIETFHQHNVQYILNTNIKKVEGHTVHLDNGQSLDCDLIISSIGIIPNTQFLKTSNVQVNDEGFIPINAYGQTNIKNIYALGDIALTQYLHVDLPVNVPLAWPAHRLAYIISQHLNGQCIPFKGLLSVSIVRLFNLTLGSVGLSLKDLTHFDYYVIDHIQNHKSGYMNGAEKMTLKVYVEQSSGKILRAAIIGKEGVDKRLDVLSTHIRLNGTVYELVEIEPAYHPAFSHPKSILNMIGYKALEHKKNPND